MADDLTYLKRNEEHRMLGAGKGNQWTDKDWNSVRNRDHNFVCNCHRRCSDVLPCRSLPNKSLGSYWCLSQWSSLIVRDLPSGGEVLEKNCFLRHQQRLIPIRKSVSVSSIRWKCCGVCCSKYFLIPAHWLLMRLICCVTDLINKGFLSISIYVVTVSLSRWFVTTLVTSQKKQATFMTSLIQLQSCSLMYPVAGRSKNFSAVWRIIFYWIRIWFLISIR